MLVTSHQPLTFPTDTLQNIFFCVQQMKETHTGLEQLDDE